MKKAIRLFWRVWPILAVCFFWFIFSSPYFLRGLMPFPSKELVTFFPPWNASYAMPVKNNAMPDIVTQIYPWKKFTIEMWKNGTVPLWNPYSFSGTPHAANYQTAVFSPFNLLFFVLPEKDAWSMLVLFQPLLAGLFMLLFLSSLERRKASCVIGGVSYMFCGFVVVWMAYATLVYAALFLPLSLYAVRSIFQKSTWWFHVLLSVSVALSFLAGHFQISLYVLAFTVAYILYESYRTGKIRPAARALLFSLLGLFLAAPQLILSFAAYRNSVRSVSPAVGAIPWRYIITLLIPDFYGNPVTRNDWFGYYAEWAGFFGVVPFILAAYALVGRHEKPVWFFFGSALVSLLIAFPSPLNQLIVTMKIPILSTSAYRIIVLSSFSLSVLAGFGLDALIEDWNRKKHVYRRSGIVLLVSMIALWAVCIRPGFLPPDKQIIALRNSILPFGFTVLVFSLVALGYYRTGRFRKAIIIAFIFLTGFDMIRFASKWMPFDPREYVYPVTPLITYLQNEVGTNRIFGNFGNELNTYFSIPSIEGYDALYQARYGAFISSASSGVTGNLARSVVLLDKSGTYDETVFQLLGVKYLVHKISDGTNIWAYPYWRYPNYALRYKDEYYEVLENTKAFPRAFLASDYVVAKNDQEILNTLYSPGTNLHETLVLEDTPAIVPSRSSGTASIIRYEPSEVVVSVTAESPKLLFLSDVYDAGWKAFVDGVPTTVYRANFAFRAVAVNEGEHTIQFFYQPDGFVWGVRLALLTLGVLLIGSIRRFT